MKLSLLLKLLEINEESFARLSSRWCIVEAEDYTKEGEMPARCPRLHKNILHLFNTYV